MKYWYEIVSMIHFKENEVVQNHVYYMLFCLVRICTQCLESEIISLKNTQEVADKKLQSGNWCLGDRNGRTTFHSIFFAII